MTRQFQLVIFDLDDTLFDTLGQLAGSYKNISHITLFAGVRPVLLYLKNAGVKLFLVSVGDQKIQRQKIDVLGLAGDFTGIFVCPFREDKEEIFKRLIADYAAGEAVKVLVVGDRIDSEICYGNKLGCVTVRVLTGRYRDLKSSNDLEKPDYEIKDIADLPELL